jgi:uncharacterized membrane protein
VLSATVIVGGAALAWALTLGGADIERRTLLGVCERYEWLFWGSLALIVATGVGNLGAYGEGLPGPETAWGQQLQSKVGLVVLLMLTSMVRTFTVVRLSKGGAEARRGALRNLYGVTALLGVLIVALAELLAHG